MYAICKVAHTLKAVLEVNITATYISDNKKP